MPTSVKLKNGIELKLEQRAFASGGEGELFRIINPVSYQNQVVKIYKLEKRTKEREEKTEFLASNPPSFQFQEGHHSVVWVNEVVFENGKFCGFTMAMAKGEKLELLCHPQLPRTLNNEWSKFDFKDRKAIELRLKLCFNIAVAIYHIHKLGNYVLVDLKPENIMVQSNGLISIIDIDSIAVKKNNKIIFSAPVATPEYTPPEFYNKSSNNDTIINETWDRFSMSVIFYRLLCGIHPFTGSCNSPYDKCNGLADMVQNGLFPHGLKSSYFNVIPPPHNKFRVVSQEIQELFKGCFNEGHSNPNNRPNADEWCRCLSPGQVLQLKRPLPSSIVPFPTYNYSKEILYNPSTKLEIPSTYFVNPRYRNPFKLLASWIFGKNNEHLIVTNLAQLESELKLRVKKYEIFSSELQNIISAFSASQHAIISNEKDLVRQLKAKVLVEITRIDHKAKELHGLETNELSSAASIFSSSRSDLEVRLKQTYTGLLGKKIEDHEKQKSALQKRIAALEIDKHVEIKNLINSPTKLSRYLIKDASIRNFVSSTSRALASVGIYSAADFIAISSDGYLQNRYGKWVKANGVGFNRAYALKEWQRSVEKSEDQFITSNSSLSYKIQFDSINRDIRNLEYSFNKVIKPFQGQYEKEKILIDSLKSTLNVQYKKKIEEVNFSYDKLHYNIINELKDFIDKNSSKLTNIKAETDRLIQENYNKYVSQFSSKKDEVNEFTSELKIDIFKLSELQQKYNRNIF